MSIIEQLDALHAKATPGKWEGGGGVGVGDASISCRCCADPDSEVADANDELIATLHNAYPAISRVLKAAQAWKTEQSSSASAVIELEDAVKALEASE